MAHRPPWRPAGSAARRPAAAAAPRQALLRRRAPTVPAPRRTATILGERSARARPISSRYALGDRRVRPAARLVLHAVAELTAAFAFAPPAALAIKPPVFHAFGLYRRYWRYAGMPRPAARGHRAVSAASASSPCASRSASCSAAAVLPALDPGHRLAADAGLRRRHPPVACALSRSGGRPGRAAPPPASRRASWSPAPATPARWSCARCSKNPQLGMHAGRLPRRRAGQAGQAHPRRAGARHARRARGGRRSARRRRGDHRDADGAAARSSARSLEACRRAGVAVAGGARHVRAARRRRQRQPAAPGRDRRPAAPRADSASQPDAGLYLQGKVVLVTGAGGSIGSRAVPAGGARAGRATLCCSATARTASSTSPNRLREAHPTVRCPCRSSPTSATRRGCAPCSRAYRPAVVFHAAAHKHVPLMEAHPRRRSRTTCSARAAVVRRGARQRRRALRPDLDRQGGGADRASWARPSASPS